MTEAESLFDEQLMDYALIINTILPDLEGSNADKRKYQNVISLVADNPSDFQSTLAFQVFSNTQELIINFNTRLIEPLAPLEAGYSDVNFDGYRWHALTYFNSDKQQWIITAQRDDIRYALAEGVILQSVVPIVIGIPIAGLIVWLLIGAGLKPISRLADELKRKEATDLSVVSLTGLPRELYPLQDSTNELLNRLKASFDREKRFAADAAHELRTPISVLKIQMHNLLEEME
ncbi:MAG: hypothetical protein JKY51_00175, partial [Opitutaceae bacterium]|nr:hypothetical protein [Opitutaceae bacterium]